MSNEAVTKRLFRVAMLQSNEMDEKGCMKAADAKIAADDIYKAIQRGDKICEERGWVRVVSVEQEATIEVV
ncbi:hypothetical protein M0R72_12045 [Candidatus Pacearchaeota archaeon]|nr:hypothetical protein [Candidatus Pacearchaeota archaeon]